MGWLDTHAHTPTAMGGKTLKEPQTQTLKLVREARVLVCIIRAGWMYVHTHTRATKDTCWGIRVCTLTHTDTHACKTMHRHYFRLFMNKHSHTLLHLPEDTVVIFLHYHLFTLMAPCLPRTMCVCVFVCVCVFFFAFLHLSRLCSCFNYGVCVCWTSM